MKRYYEKIFISFFCKEKVVESKAVSLCSLMKKLSLYDIASFKAHSPAAIRKIVLLLGEVIKDRLITKNKIL